MRHMLGFLALVLASPEASFGQPVTPLRVRPEPAAQQAEAAVLAISASTGGRLVFLVSLPGAPVEGARMTIRTNTDFAFQASVVIGMLMASYQTGERLRLHYRPSTDPQFAGVIVRIDTIRPVNR